MASQNVCTLLLAVSLAAFMSGCTFGFRDVAPERIEDSDQYIAPAVLRETWEQHLTRSEVIDQLGPINPADQTDRAIAYLRCGLPGVATPAIGFETMSIRECQMVGVWFDESGHTIVVVSYLADTYNLMPMTFFLSNRNAMWPNCHDRKQWGPAPDEPSKKR